MVNFLVRMVVQAILSALLAWSLWVLLSLIGIDEIHPAVLCVNIQVIIPVLIAALGLCAGFIVYSLWVDMRASALWQWVAPVSLLLIGMSLNVYSFGFGSIWDEYFFYRRPGIDVPPLTVYVVTYPTISASFYSLGALLSKRGRRGRYGDVDPAADAGV